MIIVRSCELKTRKGFLDWISLNIRSAHQYCTYFCDDAHGDGVLLGLHPRIHLTGVIWHKSEHATARSLGRGVFTPQPRSRFIDIV